MQEREKTRMKRLGLKTKGIACLVLALVMAMGLFAVLPAQARADEEIILVQTAEDLKAAFSAARDGTMIRLQNPIFYDYYSLGGMAVSYEVTLDFAGYKLTASNESQNLPNMFSLFASIEEGASLTLVHAQVETDSKLGLVHHNYGSLIVQSTSGSGIIINRGTFSYNNCLVYSNWGHVEIVAGTLDVECLIRQNYASAVIRQGQFTSRHSFIYENLGHVRILDGSFTNLGQTFMATNKDLLIAKGDFECEEYFIYYHYGMLNIQEGTFDVKKDLVADNRNTLHLEGGHFAVEGVLSRLSTRWQDPVEIRIKGGLYELGTLPAIDSGANTRIFISGGTFRAAKDADGPLFELMGGRVSLTGGDFTSWDGNDIFREDGSQSPVYLIPEEGYTEDWSDWEASSRLVIRPLTATVRFMVKGQEQSRLTGQTITMTMPEAPAPDGDKPFLCWMDEEGLPVFDLRQLKGDQILTARFLQESDTVVSTFQAYAQAVEDQRPVIVIAADMEQTSAIDLDYDCLLVGLRSPVLSRGATMSPYECLLTVSSRHLPDQDPDDFPEDPVTVTVMDVIFDGRDIPVPMSGLWVNLLATLNLSGVTLRNHNCSEDIHDYGGAISNEGILRLFAGSSVESSRTKRSGGGVMSAGWFYMYEGSRIVDNQAMNGGGLYGLTYEESFQPWHEGDGIVMYGGEISGNQAENRGGGVVLSDARLRMEGGRITDNKAGGDGGGVSGLPSRDDWTYWAGYLEMNQGMISGNQASRGGGLGGELDGVLYGGVFGNRALSEGDDIFYASSTSSGYYTRAGLLLANPPQPQPYHALSHEGSGFASPYQVELIDGAPEPEGVLIPFVGWYADGGTFQGQEADRFVSQADSRGWPAGQAFVWSSLMFPEISNHGLALAAKSLWQGLLVLYQANFEGEDPVYDPYAYKAGASTAALANPFQRAGYRFTGWNTQANGQGQALEPGDSLQINASRVLYAQWEEETGCLKVSQTVAGDLADPNQVFNLRVSLDDPTIEGTYGQMTFVAGVANLSLKAGQTVQACGLPSGIRFQISQEPAGDYQLQINGQAVSLFEGAIETGRTQEGIFLNSLAGKGPGGGTGDPVPSTGSQAWVYPVAGLLLIIWSLGLALLVRRRVRA